MSLLARLCGGARPPDAVDRHASTLQNAPRPEANSLNQQVKQPERGHCNPSVHHNEQDIVSELLDVGPLHVLRSIV